MASRSVANATSVVVVVSNLVTICIAFRAGAESTVERSQGSLFSGR